MGQYRLDRVCIFQSGNAPIRDQVGRFQFTQNGESIFEVEPIGALEQDPDRTTQHLATAFRCCQRAWVLRRVWPAMLPDEELTQRVDVILRHLKCLVARVDRLENGISMYVSTDPPRVLYVDSLTSHERLLASVHELTHAALHPPGSDDYDEDEYHHHEEPSAHVAAARICAHFGVLDYTDVMRKRGVSEHHLGPQNDTMAEMMFQRVTAALSRPHLQPEWVQPRGPQAV
jgi:hypothetical protein